MNLSYERVEAKKMKFQQHDIDWTPEKVARFWDYIHQNSSLKQYFFGLKAGPHVVRIINKKIGFKNLHTIVDLSCGRGDIISSCMAYMKKGQSIYGTDFSAKNVEYVNSRFDGDERFKGARLVRFFPNSFFKDNSIDLVIITEVIEHLRDDELESTMLEAWRILRKGGCLLITTPNEEDLDASKMMCPDCGCMFHQWQHVRFWDIKTLRQMTDSYGFATNVLMPVLWASTRFQKAVFFVAALLNILPRSGLLYIGSKKEPSPSNIC